MKVGVVVMTLRPSYGRNSRLAGINRIAREGRESDHKSGNLADRAAYGKEKKDFRGADLLVGKRIFSKKRGANELDPLPIF